MYTRYPSKRGRLIAYNPLFSILQRFFDFFHPCSCSLFHISTAEDFYPRSTLCGRGNKIKKETNSSSTSSFHFIILWPIILLCHEYEGRWMIEVDSVLLVHYQVIRFTVWFSCSFSGSLFKIISLEVNKRT